GGGQGVGDLCFYRAHYLSGNTAPVDALCEALRDRQLNPVPVYVSALRDREVQRAVVQAFAGAQIQAVINTTGFAIQTDDTSGNTLWQQLDVPVLQAMCSGGTKVAWEARGQGLSPQDMAMNVVLPEMDGRLITRAISFKGVQRRDAALETEVVTYEPLGDRIAFVAELAARWVELRQSEVSDKRIALILANYPTRDGRLANGVGLDTPESCVRILKALQRQGYQLSHLPESGQELIEWLTAGITNDPEGRGLRPVSQGLALADYQTYFERLPAAVREGIQQRWGTPALDPDAPDALQFPVAGLELGQVFVGIQPPRGYDQDPSLNYHAPDLEPPHAYLAFYEWLRSHFQAQAIVHVGKHGNLEWLPGKSIALSEACYPEVVLGPLPHLYPFIVNDPGEGSQAKRRAQAVIIDHLTPPLTRAELYGPLLQIEGLVDEYYDAQRLDPSRLPVIRDRLLSLIQTAEVHTDLQSSRPAHQSSDLELFLLKPTQKNKNPQKTLHPNSGKTVTELEASDPKPAAFETAVLAPLDTYLCDLKEAQIRDGLHILGQCPEGRQLRDLAIAIARLPSDGRLGLTRAIAQDLDLDWDPLTANLGEALSGGDRDRLNLFNRFNRLNPFNPEPEAPGYACRTLGDAVERIEQQAAVWIDALIASPDRDRTNSTPAGTKTQRELDWIAHTLLPQLRQTSDEITNLLRGLDGRYVPSGPSGAPSRGRSDVLPTGRNFYSVDIRGLPTESAWAVGDRAASAVIERYTQDQGEYPQTLGLSMWGTATMRTGGDDMAEALALLGVRPVWEGPSRRVVDFEILPLSLLGRPRVDVTLRISGFFRDAFANLIDLFDQVVSAVAELDEPPDQNPLAARVRAETESWVAQGIPAEQAQTRSRFRIFGSKPGAYGAGLQGLIEAQNWESDRDLAHAYINWSSYAYGRAAISGQAAPEAFHQRLQSLHIVLHNQDNREHDLLDSDDYYQFQGGLTAAVRLASGLEPQVYFGDHARPENPQVRPLSAEIARVYRSRVVNPKWIAGVMRHGYKGAFEMAATVDYLFAYDATTGCVPDHMYAGVAAAYVLDPKAQAFVQTHNPWALRDMAERLLEANQRGMWKGESEVLAELRAIALQAEEKIETRSGPP
ncbi:MAG: cobaltochelatase subunit CobN, partial [Synechococcales cyanobacterium CRU_2_2]|nr:cobaltochelatase subunit CobN [Synechococcales cyanobacterium CRU_2_2]